MKKLVIFDLDGTLLNTIGGIGSACNEMLAHYGFPEWNYEDYVRFVGHGSSALIKRILPETDQQDAAFVDSAKEIYLKFYRANLCRNTFPYDGICRLLSNIQAMGVDMAVASNKFDDGTKNLIEHFFPDIRFVAVEGQKPGGPVKPDPQIVYDVLAAYGDNAPAMNEILYVGDSDTDMETAANLNIESVGVTWGFRPREEITAAGACHIVDTPQEVLRYL